MGDMMWTEINPNALPDSKIGPFLVTNNIGARNAHGRMSHVWRVHMLHLSDDPLYAPVCAFDDANRRIGALTHFAVIANPSVSND